MRHSNTIVDDDTMGLEACEIEAIKQLKASYARYFDLRNWQAFRALLADDAWFQTIEMGDDRIEGADRWVQSVSASSGDRISAHHVHMPEIVLTGPTTAYGSWSMMAYTMTPRPAWRGIRNYGYYYEDYRKEGDRWKIASYRSARQRRETLLDVVERRGPRLSSSGDVLPMARRFTRDQLVDLEAIKQLKARYFRALDTKDAVQLRRVFGDDCRFEGTSRRFAGPDEFVAGIGDHLRGAITVHHGHGPEIRLLGDDQARGVWAFNNYVDWPGTGDGARSYGHYEDNYTRRGDEWTISLLRLSYVHVEGIRHGAWSPPPQSEGSGDWLHALQLPDRDRLGDLEEIQRLKARYLRAVEASDWDRAKELLIEAVRVQTETDSWDGRDDYLGQLAMSVDGATTVHHAHMPEVRFTGRHTARAVWATFDQLEVPGRHQIVEHYGHSEDEYEKVNGDWRIASMRQRRLRTDDLMRSDG
jgi:hypothetical protein